MNYPSKTSISDFIVERLLEKIKTNNLKSGHILPSERELIREFGVSRLSCREGLAKLQGMGILNARHGKGVYISNIQDMSVNLEVLKLLQGSGEITNADLRQARLIIEPPTASLAAKNATSDERKRIKEFMIEVEKSLAGLDLIERAKRFAKADIDFHQVVASASGNSLLPMLLKSMHDHQYYICLSALILKPFIIDLGLTDHYKIADAIDSGDGEAAEKAMERHIRLRSVELFRDSKGD